MNKDGLNKSYMLNDISNIVVVRLTQYLSILKEVKKEKENINSIELAKKMKSTSAQVRKDFATFGGFGVRGKGYNIDRLIDIIEHILGIDVTNKLVLIGHGKMGSMISNNIDVLGKSFKIIGVFDKDKRKIGNKIEALNIVIDSVDNLEHFIKENKVEQVILSVVQEEAQSVTDLLIKNGVKSILNLTAYKLDVPDNVVVINADLSAKLQELNFWKNHISIWSNGVNND